MNAIDLFAHKIMVFLGILCWQGRLPPDMGDWQLDRKETFLASHLPLRTLSFSSREIVEHCRQKPDHYVAFPRFITSIQAAYSDEQLVGSLGDPTRFYLHSFLGSFEVPCTAFKDAERLRWLIHDYSSFYPLHSYPEIRPGPSSSSLWYALTVSGAASVLIVLSVFIFILFLNQAPLRFALAMSLATFFSGVYFVFNVPMAFGMAWQPLDCWRYGTSCLWLSMVFLVYAAYKRGHISMSLHRLYMLVSAIGVSLMFFGNGMDTPQFACSVVMYIPISIVMPCIAWRVSREKSKVGYFTAATIFAFFVFMLSGYSEILLWLGFSNNPSFFQFGLPFVFLFYYLDVNQQIRATSQEKEVLAQQLARAKGIEEATLWLAHDIRRPFSILTMLVDAVKRGSYRGEYIDKLVEHANRTVQSVDEMIKDVLDLGGPCHLHRNCTDLENVISKAIDTCPGHHKISVAIDHTHGVRFDGGKVERTIRNLLSNAHDVMPQHGQIWIETHDTIADGRELVLVVVGNSDSLIAAENLERIFSQSISLKETPGKGLGLAICRRFVESHGGRIWCTSSETLGTEFRFTLAIE